MRAATSSSGSVGATAVSGVLMNAGGACTADLRGHNAQVFATQRPPFFW